VFLGLNRHVLESRRSSLSCQDFPGLTMSGVFCGLSKSSARSLLSRKHCLSPLRSASSLFLGSRPSNS